MYSLTKKAIAEFIGTFVLVFFACGTAIVSEGDYVATALSFGLVIVAMAYSIGNISGCHINPAVSIGLFINKKMTLKEFLVYIGSQFLGAIAGAALLFGICKLTGVDLGGYACNAIKGEGAGGVIGSLLMEVVLTFVFVYLIINVVNSEKSGNMGGIIIGLTLTLVHLLGIGVTGTSVNPARSFGPALMALVFGGGSVPISQVWLFIVAPLAGGALAALVYKVLHLNK